MKLLVTKINSSNVLELPHQAIQFHCESEMIGDKIIITKNPQLTDDEFGALAGKLVMVGYNVELI